jgi:Family of unknown function (DUF6065)
LHKITAFKINDVSADINLPNAKREWMDDTWDAHAYRCFPVTLGNQTGWTLSFPEDISFIWDGISDSSPDHVKILSGNKYVYTGRANGTISFKTGIMFKTEEDVTLMHMPVPNQFIDGVQAFTTLISTSFFHGEFPCAWMITKPNVEIFIKANTPIISILPINLLNLNESEIEIKNKEYAPPSPYTPNYPNVIAEYGKKNEWSNFYRDAKNDIGKTIGKHQLKSIKLNIKNL